MSDENNPNFEELIECSNVSQTAQELFYEQLEEFKGKVSEKFHRVAEEKVENYLSEELPENQPPMESDKPLLNAKSYLDDMETNYNRIVLEPNGEEAIQEMLDNSIDNYPPAISREEWPEINALFRFTYGKTLKGAQ